MPTVSSPLLTVPSLSVALFSPSPPRLRFRQPIATAYASSERNETSSSSSSSCSYLTRPSATTSLYQILDIPVSATNHEIKSAYRRLARIFHPDVVEDSSADEFIRIQTAYSTLSDPEKRADYDRKLFLRRKRPLTSMSGFSGYSGRNWETDQCW